jgi:hypothetical protein
MSEDPLTTVTRWTDSGAECRIVELTEEVAVVELRTCHGEFVERLESSDRALLRHLRESAETG